MSVEIFDRSQFEKALSFAPLGYHLLGVQSGQLVYQISVASQITCSCEHTFYPMSRHTQCPVCGQVGTVSKTSVMPGEVFIKIYSSIDPISGLSRNTGKDSIRLVLVSKSGHPLSKSGQYITRVRGWERRIKDKCRELYALALSLPVCSKGHRAGCYTCRSGRNVGRRFYKCFHCNEWLGWKGD